MCGKTEAEKQNQKEGDTGTWFLAVNFFILDFPRLLLLDLGTTLGNCEITCALIISHLFAFASAPYAVCLLLSSSSEGRLLPSPQEILSTPLRIMSVVSVSHIG